MLPQLSSTFEEKWLLNSQFWHLVERIAKKLTRDPSVSWEDAAQEARIKVLKMARDGKFNQGSVKDFYRWATKVSKRAVIDFVRKSKPCQSLDKSIPGTDTPLIDTIADDFDAMDALENKDLKRRIVEAIATLDQIYPKRHYWQIWQGLLTHKDQTQLAKELGCNQSTISRHWKELAVLIAKELGFIEIENSQHKLPNCKQNIQKTANLR